MIRFKDETTRMISEGETPRGMALGLARTTRRKLDQLERATSPDDLREPLGNRLHRLSGDRDGQWSVSVNMQYRLCFRWDLEGAFDVELVDYH